MKGSILNFLGRGSAFNYLEDNTCAYFNIGKHMYLFDCGEKIASKIIYLNLLDDIKQLTIFVTHLHSDHVGSLEPLLTYIKVFKPEIKVNCVFKQKDKLHSLLTNLSYGFDIDIYDSYSDENIDVTIIDQPHIGDCYGYIVYSEEANFFYSGDTSSVNNEALSLLEDGTLDFFYHEVSLKQSKFHTGLDTLNELICKPLRSKVYLMHFEDERTMFACLEDGYNIVK